MNTQVLTTRGSRGARYPGTTLERLARRTGLALLRWSSRQPESGAPSSAAVQAQLADDSLRATTTNDAQQRVLLVRPF